MNEDRSRVEFERWISRMPYEKSTDRHTAESSWPGAYKNYETHIAWDAWRAAQKELQRVSDLLSEVAGCGISRTADGRYHEVQIPLELWDAIQGKTRYPIA